MRKAAVKLALGGKKRGLRFTTWAFHRLKKEHGVAFGAEMAEADFDLDMVLMLLWASLLHENDDLEVRTVADWMDGESLEDVSLAVGQALGTFFGMVEDSGKDEADPGATG